MAYLYLGLAIAAEVFGTFSLKQANGFSAWWPSIRVICAYIVSFYFLSKAIQSIPVGIAYAIWSGVGIVALALIGKIFLKQSLDTAAIIGMGFIILGILIMNLFSRSVGH
ncbi:DMT family transporter [Brackiella oedipodis]|uniref:DMT family transporter n=1 Tax=Brackiella oedipodis TaxID=124225 RepID=UPI00048B0984|nr:multidrug efflux SMR transporter [Brackiella oedipodis]